MGTPSVNREKELADPFCIGDWLVHASANQLSKFDETIKLEPRTMEVLLYLARRPGQVVAREQLEKDIWENRVVGYDSLNITISKLRRALADDAKAPRFVETIPKVGYRFIGTVCDQLPPSPTGEVDARAKTETAESATPKTWSSLRSRPALIMMVLTLGAAMVTFAWVSLGNMTDGDQQGADSGPAVLVDKYSIAVLPFQNLSGDPEQEYFSDGITDDLITDLSKISGLAVISRNSVFAYKDKSDDIRNIARQLGVRYVLEGSVRKARDRVRINVQLIDAPTGAQLWADRYNGPLTDVFTLQDDVVGRIIAALEVRITPREKESTEIRGSRDVAAYDAFLRGLALLSRETPEDAAAAIPFFRAALVRDPDYGRAYAALAQTYWHYAIDQRFNKLIAPSAGTWAPGGYSNYLAAWKSLRDARIRPTSEAYALSARMLLRQRRFNAAMKDAHKAIDLEPSSPSAQEAFIEALIYTGNARVALQRIEDSIAFDPSLPGERLFLAGLAHYSLGNLDEAIQAVRRARIHNPGQTRYAAIFAASLAESGRREEAGVALRDYLTGWETFTDLHQIMHEWPFRRQSTAQRLADSLINAGIPAPREQYVAVTPTERLTGQEITSLLSNKKMVGIDRGHPGGGKFDVTWDEDVQIIDQSFVTYFRDDGKTRVTDDLLCSPWRDWGHYCVAVFRNPAGSPERLDEYIFFTLTSTYTFSSVEPATRARRTRPETVLNASQ